MVDVLVRRIGYGCTLGMDVTGGSNFVVLGSVVDQIDGDGGTADVATMEILTDIWKPKGCAGKDAGKITFMVAYDPTATTTTAARLSAARNLAGVTPPAFQLTYPAVGAENVAVVENFAGWVTKLGRSLAKAKMIVGAVEIDISGSPGMAGA